jgi:hypothetical protein
MPVSKGLNTLTETTIFDKETADNPPPIISSSQYSTKVKVDICGQNLALVLCREQYASYP